MQKQKMPNAWVASQRRHIEKVMPGDWEEEADGDGVAEGTADTEAG